jgi:UDP-glucuronate 4-epimerase
VKFLVTGAAGFIGAHLASKLAFMGHQIVAVDNFSDYYAAELKKLRVDKLLSVKEIEFHECDISDRGQANSLFLKNTFDSVFHLAAQPGVRLPNSEYFKYVDNNLVAFENILSATVSSRTPNFLYASSSSVYGNSKLIPYSEKEKGLEPVSFYGATKLANEILVPSLVRNSATKARGMRFFTVYGPWGRPDMAYFRIIAKALVGSPFAVFGDGNVIRDFTYVSDVIESIIGLNQELSDHPFGFSDFVNIGGGKPSSLNGMIAQICTQLEFTSKFENAEFNINDVEGTHADTSYLYALTGNRPATSLQEGLAYVIDWAKAPDIRSKLKEWVASVS